MSDDAGLVALEYLLNGSKLSLENAALSAMADERNLRKEMLELFEKWAERRAQVLLLEWFRKHGEELMGSVTRTVVINEIGRLSGFEEPTEDFREALKNLVKTA